MNVVLFALIAATGIAGSVLGLVTCHMRQSRSPFVRLVVAYRANSVSMLATTFSAAVFAWQDYDKLACVFAVVACACAWCGGYWQLQDAHLANAMAASQEQAQEVFK